VNHSVPGLAEKMAELLGSELESFGLSIVSTPHGKALRTEKPLRRAQVFLPSLFFFLMSQ